MRSSFASRSVGHVALAAIGSALLVACSGAKLRVEVGKPAPAPEAIAKLAAGSTLVVPRPTGGAARLSLWFDAGARDGVPPQLALASAFWAEAHTGSSARVLPDGTELSMLCDTRSGGIAACIERLGRAFVLPAPKAGDVESLRTRVRRSRARAQGDDARTADGLAIGALFGESASAFFPFGAEGDDGRIDEATIQRFAGEHFQPGRALLIAAGDVTESEVARAFARAAAQARGVAKPRAADFVTMQSGLRTQWGDQSWLAFALAAPSSEAAAAVAFRIQRLYPQASAHISSVRGARLLHLRMPAGNRPLRRLQRAVFDLRRLALEANGAFAPRPEESLENLTRLLGEDWAARGNITAPIAQWPLGVGITLKSDALPREGRGAARAKDADPDKKLAAFTNDAEAAVAAGEQNSRGDTRGALDPQGASVTVANGVRVEVRRRAGDAWMAGLVRFAGGSELDGVTRHGRSALLATLMTDSCRFTGETSLDETLAQLNAKLVPLVSSNHVGLLITAPNARWAEALDAVIRCALGPQLTSRALDDARVKLLRTLWTRPERRLESALGHLLTPSAPGTLAPWGSPQAIASVHINEIRRLHAELLVGARISVLALADADTEQVTRFVARRVAQLAAGRAPARAGALPGPEFMRGELTEKGPLRVLVGFRVGEADAEALVARVFARALGQALARRGLDTLASWGESNGALMLAGAAVALREDALAIFDRTLRDALTELQRLPDKTVTQLLAQAELERNARRSSARGYAQAFFDGTLSARDASASARVAWFRKLAASPPAYAVLRPAP